MAKSHPRNDNGGEELFPAAARNNAKYDPEREVQKLRLQMQSLEAELRHLTPVRNQLDQAYNQNRKLAKVLEQSKEQIEALKEEVEKLSLPPNPYGFFSSRNDDDTINIYVSGRKMKVHVHPSIDPATLEQGQELVLNEAFNVVEVKGFQEQGEVVSIKELLDDHRAIVALHADEERVVSISEHLHPEDGLHVGDHVLLDTQSGYLLERLPKCEAEELVIEEVPDIDYNRIGGLSTQIEEIRDAVELPFLHPDLFREHKLDPPKGILLYGPPGCGKTLIAKAVANAIGKRVGEREGTDEKARRSFFLHIKGPELLNKYVGESERKIREIFEKAKEKADRGVPVIIFFDEMDSLFRTRGTGVSSDMESTIVPQFLAEIDGVERLRNVIVIGATNRQDLIDPAVLRPGRLDVKIKVDRPDEAAARSIFEKYLTADLPLHPEAFDSKDEPAEEAVARMIGRVVERMYADTEDNQFLEVTYANGEREICYFKDFASGAMIEGMVARAKKYAIKRAIDEGQKGIRLDDLVAAMRQEFRENEDLPNNTNPDDWAKIAGRKGERIVNIRTITNEPGAEPKEITPVSAGHYL